MPKNAWENVDALGGVPQSVARSAIGFWGWVLRLLVVAGLTLAGAFYWPLYKAHKELTAEYAALNQRAENIGQELGSLKTDLASAKAKRDELEARRGMDQTRERASHELVEQIKSDLSSKLARYVDKGTIAIAIRRSRVNVHFPSAIAENAGRMDVSPDARLALCALSSVVIARGPTDVRIVAHDDGAGADPEKPRAPWELAAERSATLARVLVDKCKYPADHVEAIARPPVGANDSNGEGASTKGAVDVEIDPGGGSTLTPL